MSTQSPPPWGCDLRPELWVPEWTTLCLSVFQVGQSAVLNSC